MKRTGFILTALSFLLLGGCGIANMTADITCRDMGYALLLDGSSVNGQIKIPDSFDKTVRIKTRNKGVRHIPSSEIASLHVHREKHPDKVHVLCYMETFSPTTFSSQNRKSYPARWVLLEHSGPKICFYTLGHFYSIQRDGEISVVSQMGEEVEFIARKTCDRSGFRVGVKGGSPQWFRESLKQYMSDDAVICKDIDNKRIIYNDFGSICQTYNPQW